MSKAARQRSARERLAEERKKQQQKQQRTRTLLISLSALPVGRAAAMPEEQIAGYNIASWTDNGVAYWAVSDVAAADLNAFVKAFRAAPSDR